MANIEKSKDVLPPKNNWQWNEMKRECPTQLKTMWLLVFTFNNNSFKNKQKITTQKPPLLQLQSQKMMKLYNNYKYIKKKKKATLNPFWSSPKPLLHSRTLQETLTKIMEEFLKILLKKHECHLKDYFQIYFTPG